MSPISSRSDPRRGLDRRLFLTRLTAAGAGLMGVSACRRWVRPRFGANPFTLGVASGDPTANGVVLWTRLALDPMQGGGLPAEQVEVLWEVAADERFSRVLRSGMAAAAPELGHSVHVEVDGLDPDRWYWYRFRAGGEESAVGRTRTVPLGRPDRFRFAFVSCQHFEQGLYTAYEHLADEDLSLVVHLGDYIYETAARDAQVRRHASDEIESLDDYRNRYAQYRLDPLLQRAHARFPWVVTWDDHEVDNNYAGPFAQDSTPEAQFLERRAHAYQAYYEVMPLRRTTLPRGPDMHLFRRVDVGTLATFYVLDTRQYRTDQPCGDGVKPACDGVFDPDARMLGQEQERWLFRELDRSPAHWNILAQQVPLVTMERGDPESPKYSMDKWGAYAVPQWRVTRRLADGVSNPVVLTGDVHTNWVGDVRTSYEDPDAPTVATELIGTSISSGGDGGDYPETRAAIMSRQPHIRYFNAERGYVRCDLSGDRWTADFRTVPYVSRPGAPIVTRASFVVTSGRPGAVRA